MYKVLLFLVISAFGLNMATASQEKPSGPTYDAALAERLGADQYGMKSYVLVILTTGEMDATITDKKQRQDLFAGHFANMSRLAEAGQLVLAGPFIDAKPKRGLLILNTNSLEQAEQLVSTDPAVQAGIFNFELSQYYGSAALMEINQLHKQIQKAPIE